MNLRKQQEIFDEWLGKHKGLVFKVVRAYAFSPQDRDDLFQEITTQVWLSIPNFRGDSTVTTWMYRVALYTAIAWTRKEKKHHDGKERFTGVEARLTTTDTKDDRLEWLYDQIAKLNPIDRSLTLLLLDGFSYKEIGATLGITKNHVGVKLNRIKKYLAQLSEEEAHHGV